MTDESVQYETPMTEIEEVKAQIKVLEKKLALLKELEKTKSPAEEGYKKVYGYYPAPYGEDCYWEYFQNGYKQAQKDYKVGEHQEPAQEPQGPKTLYQMFYDDKLPAAQCKILCEFVKEWIYQYDCDYATCKEYLEGYEECQTVLEERLK